MGLELFGLGIRRLGVLVDPLEYRQCGHGTADGISYSLSPTTKFSESKFILKAADLGSKSCLWWISCVCRAGNRQSFHCNTGYECYRSLSLDSFLLDHVETRQDGKTVGPRRQTELQYLLSEFWWAYARVCHLLALGWNKCRTNRRISHDLYSVLLINPESCRCLDNFLDSGTGSSSDRLRF